MPEAPNPIRAAPSQDLKEAGDRLAYSSDIEDVYEFERAVREDERAKFAARIEELEAALRSVSYEMIEVQYGCSEGDARAYADIALNAIRRVLNPIPAPSDGGAH